MPQKTTLQTFGLFLSLALIVAFAPLLWSLQIGGDHKAGLAVGEVAPAIAGAGWVNGPEPEPASVRGKVIVVDSWFLTCPWCHKGMPELVSLWKKHREQGVVFLGVTFEPPEKLEQIQEFTDRYEAGWPVAYGALPTLEKLKGEYFPGYWVIGKDGRVIWNKSMESRETMGEAIERALREPDAAAGI